MIRRLLVAMALSLLAAPAAASAGPLDLALRLPLGMPPHVRDLLTRAQGETRPPGPRSPSFPGFTVKAQDGFRIGVMGVGSSVAVYVTRGRALAATAYVVRGTATPWQLRASFGKYGEVSMRFRPSSAEPRRAPRADCRGRGRFVDRDGVFVGNFRFRGEDGYVSVRAHRVAARVRTVDSRCRLRSGDGRQERGVRPAQESPWGLDPSFLGASWRRAVASARFGAIGIVGERLFVAATEESEGALAKLRVAIATAGAKTFTIDDPLTVARVAPPKPFRGVGTYRAAPDGTKTWDGTLSVNFPGAARFPLAGPPFTAELGASVFGEEGSPPFSGLGGP